jgi:uncharacterized protein
MATTSTTAPVLRPVPPAPVSIPDPVWIYGHSKITEDKVLDFVKRTFLDRSNDYQVIVGTDSHTEGRMFRFVTIVCVYTVGKGGDFCRLMSYQPKTTFAATGDSKGTEVGNKRRKQNHKLRMFNEVAKSIEIADWIKEQTGVTATLHIDASPPGARHFTSAFSTELAGYASASGYEAVLKPYSFAANSVADRYSK